MKKLLILLLAGITFYACQENLIEEFQENSLATRAEIGSSGYYYWCDGVKIPLTINENKLFVVAETAKYESISKSAISAGNKIESSRTINNYAPLGIELSGKNAKMQTSVTLFTLDNANLKSIDTRNLVYVAPYFKTSDGIDIGITNIFNVQLKGEESLIELQKIAEEYNLEMLGENRFDPSIYYFSCTKESKGNALEMANFMYESGAFEYATPEFLIESKGDVYTNPNDSCFDNQWNLYNNHLDVDINYVEVMTAFSFPNISNIIVAVVDDGIYNNHNDLPLHNVSYNAHTGGSTSGLYGDHGTEVAGVIGATTNNGQGIAGVASGVKIMPISLCFTENAAKLGISASNTTHFANAIRFAADNGARVINNSWSFDTSSPVSEINNAIRYAQSKGCVVVFSSGNNHPNRAVKQPAAGAPSETLVVGAINRTGYRADYSGYGSSLDVVAPGTGIWTTTTTGGYSSSIGTSFAAPHVAGVAALMLSRNPNLTYKQVESIIQNRAKRYSLPYSFGSTSTNVFWNNEVGYGLVDAYAAVNEALPKPFISGPANVTVGDHVTYTMTGAPSNSNCQYVWNIPNANEISRSGKAITVYFTTAGIQTITGNYIKPNDPVPSSTVSYEVNVADGTTFPIDIQWTVVGYGCWSDNEVFIIDENNNTVYNSNQASGGYCNSYDMSPSTHSLHDMFAYSFVSDAYYEQYNERVPYHLVMGSESLSYCDSYGQDHQIYGKHYYFRQPKLGQGTYRIVFAASNFDYVYWEEFEVTSSGVNYPDGQPAIHVLLDGTSDSTNMWLSTKGYYTEWNGYYYAVGSRYEYNNHYLWPNWNDRATSDV